jgi:hypothetical protein
MVLNISKIIIFEIILMKLKGYIFIFGIPEEGSESTKTWAFVKRFLVHEGTNQAITLAMCERFSPNFFLG